MWIFHIPYTLHFCKHTRVKSIRRKFYVERVDSSLSFKNHSSTYTPHTRWIPIFTNIAPAYLHIPFGRDDSAKTNFTHGWLRQIWSPFLWIVHSIMLESKIKILCLREIEYLHYLSCHSYCPCLFKSCALNLHKLCTIS